MASSNFAVPLSFQDLERDYNLLPYPEDFDDSGDSERKESFQSLVTLIEQGNRFLLSEQEEEDEEWIEKERLQALYTLIR